MRLSAFIIMRNLTDYAKKAHEKHKNKYQYLRLTTENGFRRIYLSCPFHGEFNQIADTHLTGAGCLKCYHEKKKEQQTESLEDFIIKADILYNKLYEYIELIPKIKNKYRRIKYICKEHGEIIQNADNHLKGWGCNQCGYEKASEKLSDSFDIWVQKSKIIHGDCYSYICLVGKNPRKSLKIKCQKHGIFTQLVSSHLSGSGCPKCAYSNSSKRENIWLDSIGISEENRQVILPFLGRIKVDGYDPETKTAYEFYGDYWHGNPKIYDPNKINVRNQKPFGYLYQQTLIRENKIRKHYKLQTIWENDWVIQSTEKYETI